jgi:biopolymer transport protein ExbB
LLTVFAQQPDWKARIQQGGIIGYVIIGLGGIGLLIALERLLVLTIVGVRVKRQVKTEHPHSGNPLGRLMQVAGESSEENPETLSLKLDDSILREIPSLQRGLGSLSVLAAVAPLLGLLGTVIGIIETFQSITLFGAGDPRLMSGGISLALVTTVMGLVAAIPLLLLQSFLLGKSNWIIQILDESSAAAIAEAAERRHVA